MAGQLKYREVRYLIGKKLNYKMVIIELYFNLFLIS